MLNFDRSTVKHCTQNIQNGCHQWFSDSFRVHQIRFRPGLRPDPTRGDRDPLAGLRDLNSKSSGSGGRGKGREERGGREREGPPPFSKIPGSGLCIEYLYHTDFAPEVAF